MNLRKGGSCGKGQERMGARDTIKLKFLSGHALDLRNKMTLNFVWKENGAFNRKR